MSAPLIGTHSGHFHADEALAVHLLRLLPTYRDSGLIRTRDPTKLDQCHVVVDVHGQYDPDKSLFDHHQREFKITFPNHKTKLSSAGLIYLHFGKDIIAQATGLPKDNMDIDILYNKLYDCFIEAFDANDNGVSPYDSTQLTNCGIEKRFDDSGYSLASVVNRYNHHYDNDLGKTPEQLQLEEDQRFLKASAFVGEQFSEELKDKWQAWLPARKVVEQAFKERYKHEEQGRVMVLPEGMPWADHLYQLEKASGDVEQNQVLYVLFPENKDVDSKWRIRAVSVEGAGFTNRKDLPDAWKGLRDKELDQVSGTLGCVFVHAAGFIGGNKTFEGAMQMAQKAVSTTQPNSADLKSICGKNAGAVKSAISSGCGSNADLALADFNKVCAGVTPNDGGSSNSTSITSSPGASATGGSASGQSIIVYTSTYYDSACSCTKTQAKTTTAVLGPSGFPTMSAGTNSTVPTAPVQPSGPVATSGGSAGSTSPTSSGSVASSTGAASSLELGNFAGIAVAAVGFALAW
ncbi:MAG: hypothetical protein M1821_005891 [Bathelium mastoideum]|nr:MAG: hypothetical protein M1821_005891 [Bathelium mastoideum]KAI9688573.1 MAG: hypothetical protein M1822_001522 [Bathelium mastoideum]